MFNTQSLDRFAVGLADPQEHEPKVICRCNNIECTEMIVEGYEAFVFDDVYYCSKECFADTLGLEEVEWN